VIERVATLPGRTTSGPAPAPRRRHTGVGWCRVIPPMSFLLFALSSTLLHAASERNPACALTAGPKRAVVKVIDAQTVALDDGAEVRLIGALSPGAPTAEIPIGRWSPARQAKAALEKLVLGRSVQLKFAGERRDRYGRFLAHMFVVGQDHGTWVQAEMVARGHARVYSYRRSRACVRDLLIQEAQARTARRGLWRHAAYAVRQAWRARELMRFRHSYQLVEGRVLKVAKVGRRTFLNFGRKWRQDFTIVVTGRDHRAFEKSGLKLGELEGERVRVRGWLERWNGPLIRATHPEQLEVLGKRRRRSARKRRPRDDDAKSPRRQQKAKDPAPAVPGLKSL